MPRTSKEELLASGNFAELFNANGWNNARTQDPLAIDVGPADARRTFEFHEVAFLNVRVLSCATSLFPTSSERAAIDLRLRRTGDTYLAVFFDPADRSRQLWMVPVHAVDRRKLVVVSCETTAQRTFFLEKIDRLTFPIGRQPAAVDVITAVDKAFLVNSDDVTARFYREFTAHHKAMANAIEFADRPRPIAEEEARKLDEKEHAEYASVMLDRLMFCYFIQKKGFLDDDIDYLFTRLRNVQSKKGPDKFYGSFYKRFLRALFEGGLNTPAVKRTATFEREFGRIPYLNGGLFARHPLEIAHEIDIPDVVFENLFAFFNQWNWYLDTRLSSEGKDINPDVLGYIFEKYINEAEKGKKGAYYTKEDITEYIGRNTIVPWLLQKALGGNGISSLQSLLASDPDRYVFPAMRKGADLDLPPEIEQGVSVEPQDTLRTRRTDWNKIADEDFALPAEIWRETVARRQRYRDLREKLSIGQIRDISDFTTYNLDIRVFAEDAIRRSSDHLFVRHFYEALRSVTVLDPTCGSGAFLFAAMNILEPLYEACLDRMEEFNANNPHLFKDELAQLRDAFRSNRQHFIYKSIILNNLYGVDLMPEAVEIAKLRLFLKMVSVVEADFSRPGENFGLDPLPDIDFNIRCGNTLVGFASPKAVEDALVPQGRLGLDKDEFKKVERKAADVSAVFARFRTLQLDGGDTTDAKECKNDLRKKLDALNAQLDKTLAGVSYSIDVKDADAFGKWKASHQPFHWYSEFFDIIVERGGFDVIIGNPPYVEYSKVEDYTVKGFDTEQCGDLYCMVMERAFSILKELSLFGMIVPISISASGKMSRIRELLSNGKSCNWVSSFSNRPSQLFEGAQNRLSIVISNRGVSSSSLYCSKYIRWDQKNGEREALFQTLSYGPKHVSTQKPFPKTGNSICESILAKMSTKDPLCISEAKSREFSLFWVRVPGYFCQFTDWHLQAIPVAGGLPRNRGEILSIAFDSAETRNICCAILNSSAFYLFFNIFTDTRHINPSDVRAFPLSVKTLTSSLRQQINHLWGTLSQNFHKHIGFVQKAGLKVESLDSITAKPIIDEIDVLLAKHYGFSEEELDYIINYDIKYRVS